MSKAKTKSVRKPNAMRQIAGMFLRGEIRVDSREHEEPVVIHQAYQDLKNPAAYGQDLADTDRLEF